MTVGVHTLQQAHEAVAARWPGRDASAAAWRAYHEHAATLYAHVAQVDHAHHHEALFWAGQEREDAVALDQITTPSMAMAPGEGEGGCDD